ncbi:MAG: PQQ-dependent sugar dehydrogenase [Verrucomicrobiales bacterium]
MKPVLFFLFFLLSLAAIAEEPIDYSKLKVDELFNTLCATCHGEQLDQGLGGSLVDGVWKHGSSDEEITASIKEGNPELGMTPFGTVLNDEQIRSLVIYIREKEFEAKNQATEFPRPEPGKVTQTQYADYQIETFVEDGLELPWAIAFLPDGRKLVTERPGRLRLIEADGSLQEAPILETPPVIAHGQGGMMEVAVHPDFIENGWIYLAYADGWREPAEEEGKKGRAKTITKVVRGRITEGRWTDEETIWQSPREFYTSDGVHFGTRIVFQDGYIYFIVGERNGKMEVQDLANPKGKIYRLHDDGRIPEDGPFVDRDEALDGIWTYGHRNPQGLALHPVTGELFSTEHGPRGGDELNLIEPGNNYGWPVITHGMNYDGTPMTSETAREGMEQPLIHWTPSLAVCGLDFYTGSAFPGWENDLFAGALRKEEVRRLRLEKGKVIEQEVILKNLGRVRDVATGPDGYLYILLNKPDSILRLVPTP